MDSFKSQIIHVVQTVDKLAMPDRIEALSYLQKITEAFKNDSLPTDLTPNDKPNPDPSMKAPSKTMKHKCKNHLCLINNIKHLKKIACFKCDKRLESEFQLYEHSQVHLDYPLSCIHCRCTFRNIEDFNGHRTIDCKQIGKDSLQNSEKYRCTVCSSSFGNKKTFHSHLLNSHGLKLYNNWYGCKLCREMFEQKKMLYHHYKQAHSETNSQWKIMPKGNKNKTDMHDAIENQAPNDGEGDKFQCYHCHRYFQKKFALAVHMKRHIQRNGLYCDSCKKSFIQYRYYQRHLRSASHIKKLGLDNHPLHKCELCECKIFCNKQALTQHMMRIHSSEKSLKCPLCDFKTGLIASLNRHINLHTGNRKFICDQCGACFHTHSALKDHSTAIHLNERNYSCEVCGQRFKLKSGLNRHFKTHSDSKEFKCFCGQVYKFRTNLQRHLVNAHNVTEKKNRVFRVTTEDEGYAMNNPQVVQRKAAKQKKTDDDDDDSDVKIEDFDISSLSALSDVDLSCADEVLRETYDNLAKYSAENGGSQESFSSILGPVNSIIDHVLQESSNSLRANINRLTPIEDNKQYPTISGDPMNQNLPSMNYRASTCRQFLSNTFGEEVTCDQYGQTGMRVDPNQYNINSFDVNAMCPDGYNKQYATNNYLQDLPVVDDESSFPYTRWFNEIL